MREITEEKLQKYLELTTQALDLARKSKNRTKISREEFLDMIERYLSDARHFKNKGDYVNAFAAVNYAHGWLDAGARIGVFDVHDSRLFAAD